MILRTFSIFDTKVGTYGQPFFFNHIAQASRALAELLNDPAHLAAKYPGDYQLHELATFDDATGTFTQDFQNHGSLVGFVDHRAARLPVAPMVAPSVSAVEV